MEGTGASMRFQADEMTERSDQLIGESPQIQEVRRVIQRVSQVRWPVLILGETGTGKELVARSIHATGCPDGKPFVHVDCGSPSNLIENELLGAEGQTSGEASITRGRLCELAQGGTLFLDEISELPPSAQAIIVRLIDSKIVTPAIGGDEPVRFGARIIAASRRELRSLLDGTTFRKDLFFRLNTVSLALPPLRERKADIPLLVANILRRISDSHSDLLQSRSRWVLSAKALDSLLVYDWPGNVRELEDCIKRAVILSSGRVLEPSDLFPPLQAFSSVPKDDTECAPHSLRETERKTIMESLQAAHWRKPLAAQMLGIGKSTLYRKLHEYGAKERATPKTRRKWIG
jgi:two-component system, NtrC family, response regulator AtoC